MAVFKSKNTFSLQALVLLIVIPSVKMTYFNYPSFESVLKNIDLQGEASSAGGVIQLTRNLFEVSLDRSIGRALYAEPVRIWDSSTGQVADFTTHFSFVITVPSEMEGDAGDGLTVFLVPNGTVFPSDSVGGGLGLCSTKSNSSEYPVVAIEFDTYKNVWDPTFDHVGIDINSVRSVEIKEVYEGLKVNITAHVWLSYNSITKNLSVHLIMVQDPSFYVNLTLFHILDLPSILPEWVNVGFSAATGLSSEVHNILSWEFNSTEFSSSKSTARDAKEKNGTLVIFSVVGSALFVVGIVVILFIWKKINKNRKNAENRTLATSTDDEYENETGPKKFTHSELVRATKNFCAEGKLGQGGFGSVYGGILGDSNIEVAVKRLSSNSKQGKKEFLSEVKIISKLRHRNLVQLIGWCKEKGEFLLIYEFMPNGSLDNHLFGGRTMLTWASRYKIATGLAAALLYLHEGWEQCVVHRDVKCSNIMLDSSFNAKLGDFGLARLVDHELEGKTTMLAGTLGYMAPECAVTGKAGKESDVYSFGVVALEISCGRRAIQITEERSKVGLVEWVGELYSNGRLLDAADAKLGTEFDEQQMERLMIVGLWCSNLDYKQRPSMKQAITALKFEAPLPDLSFMISVPTHFMPPACDTRGNQTQASCNSHNTNSSKSISIKSTAQT